MYLYSCDLVFNNIITYTFKSFLLCVIYKAIYWHEDWGELFENRLFYKEKKHTRKCHSHEARPS